MSSILLITKTENRIRNNENVKENEVLCPVCHVLEMVVVRGDIFHTNQRSQPTTPTEQDTATRHT
jgi:hypothetical protein